jgi:uncharacterized protein (DUF305 family)
VTARLPAATLALLAVLGLAACSGDDQATAPRPEPSLTYTAESPVVIPGLPGEEPTVVQPGQTGTIENPNVYSDADVTFVRDMALHHAQALEMAALAPDRAEDKRVRALADRISAAQGPEIDLMQAWLQQKGLPAVDLEADHHAMPGMATEEQLFALGQARGREFDRLFLQLMTAHHEGALQMVEAATEARNIIVLDLLQDVSIKQSVEIERMAQVAADLA